MTDCSLVLPSFRVHPMNDAAEEQIVPTQACFLFVHKLHDGVIYVRGSTGTIVWKGNSETLVDYMMLQLPKEPLVIVSNMMVPYALSGDGHKYIPCHTSETLRDNLRLYINFLECVESVLPNKNTEIPAKSYISSMETDTSDARQGTTSGVGSLLKLCSWLFCER